MLQHSNGGNFMTLFQKLKDYKNFTDSEKVMLELIVRDTQRATTLTIDEFAHEVYASKSSVVRFCQKLGFKGFSDFKISLATELNLFTEQEAIIHADMPISNEDSIADVLKIFSNLHFQAIESAQKSTNSESFRKAAELIEKAPLISLWGYSNSIMVAMDFNHKMRSIGYPTVCNPISGLQSVHRSRVDGEVAVIFSTFAKSEWVEHWIASLKATGRKIVLLSANPDTPLAHLVDVAILVENSEQRETKMGVFSSRSAMLYVSDCLYAVIFKMNFSDNVNRMRNALGDEFELETNYLF